MKTYTDIFESIISPENLFTAWGEFKRGKNKREDVLAFEFDQFVKHNLRVKHYCRYTDDFIIVAESQDYLIALLPQITIFLQNRLHLKLHSQKTIIRKINQGVDFLGYVKFLNYTLIRTKTRRRILRMFAKKVKRFKGGLLSEESLDCSIRSYLGVFSHADSHQLKQKFLNMVWAD